MHTLSVLTLHHTTVQVVKEQASKPLLSPVEIDDRSACPMGRRPLLGLLLAGALGVLLGCGLTAHVLRSPHQSSLMEGHSVATIDELGARLTTQMKSTEHGAHARQDTEEAEEDFEAGEEAEEEDEDEEEDEEEEEEGKEFGGIFALEEVDPLSISMLLIGLIVVTIGYEQAVDLLQEHVFSSGIGKLLLGKMVRELTKPKAP